MVIERFCSRAAHNGAAWSQCGSHRPSFLDEGLIMLRSLVARGLFQHVRKAHPEEHDGNVVASTTRTRVVWILEEATMLM